MSDTIHNQYGHVYRTKLGSKTHWYAAVPGYRRPIEVRTKGAAMWLTTNLFDHSIDENHAATLGELKAEMIALGKKRGYRFDDNGDLVLYATSRERRTLRKNVREVGIMQAQYDWVAFLVCDDVWEFIPPHELAWLVDDNVTILAPNAERDEHGLDLLAVKTVYTDAEYYQVRSWVDDLIEFGVAKLKAVQVDFKLDGFTERLADHIADQNGV